MSNLFIQRPAKESDLPLINAYAANEGMDEIPNTELVTVAVNADDVVVGFIRIALDESGVAFINPVVVYSEWRSFGVGRSLVEAALKKYGELRLVSRGSSLAFYDALGFSPCSWDLISEGVTDDCANCDMRPTCTPQPMRGFYNFPEVS